jgi:hypothetical protein
MPRKTLREKMPMRFMAIRVKGERRITTILTYWTPALNCYTTIPDR